MFVKEVMVQELQPLSDLSSVMSSEHWVCYRKFYSINLPGEHVAGYIDLAGFRIVAQIYFAQGINIDESESAERNCLLLHGYYDHTGLERHLINYWVSKGYNVATFDLPGHGLSSGAVAAIENFSQYQTVLRGVIGALQQLGWRSAYSMAQSTGGAVLSHYLLERARQKENAFVSKAILLAPLLRPYNWRWAKLAHRCVSPFRDYIKRSFSINSNDETFIKLLHDQDPLQSCHLSVKWVGALIAWERGFYALPPSNVALLILQGDKDETVNYTYNLIQYAEKFPRSRTVMFPKARHQLMNEAPIYRDRIFQEVEQFLK